ncbi:helix-turn-helix domain-containing protein [Bradyrhizobium sp. USDA 4473]
MAGTPPRDVRENSVKAPHSTIARGPAPMSAPPKYPRVYLALSPTQTATALGLHTDVVYAAIRNGELGPLYQHGSKNRLLASDVEAWVRGWKTAKRSVRNER